MDTYKDLGEPVEVRRFDPLLEQALAWKRMEKACHTENDLTWLKHEFAESVYELKKGAGYMESHSIANKKFPGYPWENEL